jgi:poly(A) polymerase
MKSISCFVIVIEVATFRADHADTSSGHAQTSEQGLLVRDNVFGNLEEDAFRRDFTVNALYYSAKDFSLRDYVGGLADLKARQLRLIGDADARYREDPVRILRAIRLACKLDLAIEAKTAAPIVELANMLDHVSSARLWDECHKLLLAGYALKTWHSLMEYDVARHLFSQTCRALEKDDSGNFSLFIDAALASTDNRIANQLPVTPAFLFAVFLWQPMQLLCDKYVADGMNFYDAGQKSATKVLDGQRQSIAIPKRFSLVVREIWSLQYRLSNRQKRSVDSLMDHPRFRAAYDFLCLRAGNDQTLVELAKWWTDYQATNDDGRAQLLKSQAKAKPRGKNRKKRRTSRFKPNASSNKSS